MSEYAKELTLKESNDLDEMPEIPISLKCKCGMDAPIQYSDSDKWTDIQGHEMHRMRVVIKCNAIGGCGERTQFRLGGVVTKNFDHVRKDK